jgi:hypothetical protein
MVIEGVATKCEKHEVVPPLVVGWRGFQNDCDHLSYILEADSLGMQVCGEGGIEVGASVDRAIIVLGDCDPVGSDELLFQVTDDGLLLLSNDGSGALARPCLMQGLACGSRGGNESLLLSVRGSSGGLNRSRGVILVPLHDGGRGGLLLIDGEVGSAAWHGRQDGGD